MVSTSFLQVTHLCDNTGQRWKDYAEAKQIISVPSISLMKGSIRGRSTPPHPEYVSRVVAAVLVFVSVLDFYELLISNESRICLINFT